MNPRDAFLLLPIVLSVMVVAGLVELMAPLFGTERAPGGRRGTNLGLTAVSLGFNSVLVSATAVAALAFPLAAPGLMVRLSLPPVARFLVSLVALDFSYGYLAHRAMHASPLLWRFHRVHHLDPFVDVTTTYRTHPVENAWRHVFLVVPIWILGVPVEAVLLYRTLSVINASFEHANLRVGPALDSAISRVWVTPNMHKVHHSRDARETDSNYGNILSLYDRLLGTFTPTERALSVRYGLEGPDRQGPATVAELILSPFRPTGPAATKG